MKPFESFLACELKKYLRYRQGLGYRDRNLGYLLGHFDRYVSGKNICCWSEFTPLLFLKFREQLRGQSSTVNTILSGVRCFFQYLVRKGRFECNPLQDIPSRTENAFIPFVFSPESVNLLLSNIRNNIRRTERYFFKDLTIYMAIVLLSRCGLRISEPLRLQLKHYRSDEKTIYVEKTKFNKDRLIPVPLAVASEIDNYLATRKNFVIRRNSFILTDIKGKPLSKKQVYRTFQPAVKEIGLAAPRRIIANTTFGSPTPHSLRHSFAINTLKDIKARGGCPQRALPVLSTYMGHRKYYYTVLYLKVLDAEQRQGLVDFSIAYEQRHTTAHQEGL